MMPGLLSSVFDGGDDASSQQNETTQDYGAGANAGVDLSPTVGVSYHGEGSWEGADGSAHNYGSDTDLVFTADVSAALAVTGALTDTSADEG